MSKTASTSTTDPQKKYWWLLLVIIPIVLALIAILPELLKKEAPQVQKITPTSVEQKAENVEQTTIQGNNYTNVQGDITTNTPPTEENGKKP
jgi:hypothetical protein